MGSSAVSFTMLMLSVFLLSCCTITVIAGISKCNSEFLDRKCKNLLKRNDKSECRGDALQLFPKCLYMASECKTFGQITDTTYLNSANANFSEAYDRLIKQVNAYRSCFTRKSMRCNESKIKDCYSVFNRNSTQICRQVHKLRLCVLLLKPRGCHEMRNPWYTIASGILKRYKSCFIRNYTVVLETLQEKTTTSQQNVSTAQPKNRTTVTPIVCVALPGASKDKWSVGYKFFAAMFVCLLIIISGIFLFVCIRRNGLTHKSRRAFSRSHSRHHIQTDLCLLDVRETRTCASNNNNNTRPLTFVINDDEAPPPYAAHDGGFLMEYIDSPPPYTSRPTSVNGDFV